MHVVRVCSGVPELWVSVMRGSLLIGEYYNKIWWIQEFSPRCWRNFDINLYS